MLEKSAAGAQTAPSRTSVRAGRTESIPERFERLNDAIARRAYDLFELSGHADGCDVENWLEAEKEILLPIAIDLEETDTEFIVRAQVPGFTASELEVNVESRKVTIAGKRESKQETKQAETTITEMSSAEIFRTVELSSDVDATKVSATLREGVLSIQIPKAASNHSADKLTA